MAKTVEDIKKLFGNKNITLMGLGLLGRGVGDAKFFAEAGAHLTITDLKTAEELKPSIDRLKKRFPNIVYHLGEHALEDFEEKDMIISAPNAPLDSPFLLHARDLNIPIERDASLFAKLTDATIVGVTGTRGKSTTTHFIYEILKAAGKTVYLGGNERDTATLPLIYKANKGDVVVLELDSWQLQGFAEDKISPHISIWTNFLSDHMNYYKGDMERYFEDKAAIARFQKSKDTFITTPEIAKAIEERFGPLASTSVTDATFPSDWKLGIPGEHNRRNAALARAAALALGVSDKIIRATFESFTGLPGRLEFLGEKNGIAFYNDSNSTTPDATMVALETMASLRTPDGKPRPLVLIAGGNDKDLDFKKLTPQIEAQAHYAVFLNGTATDKILSILNKDFPHETARSMDEAFRKAMAHAEAGAVILLSPAATSFGLFKNEYDRSDQFRALVAAVR